MMAASSVTSTSLQSPSIFRSPSPYLSVASNVFIGFQLRIPRFRLDASRRPPKFRQEGESSAVDPRNRSRNRYDMTFVGDYDVDDHEDDQEEEGDRSLDLLIRFVGNVYKKVSKRARKAFRSVLPINIPTNLDGQFCMIRTHFQSPIDPATYFVKVAHSNFHRVGFSVDGVIILAFLWILRAFLEVVCTLGSIVFVSILLVRGAWTGILYFQEGHYRRTDGLNNENQAWTGAQPVG